MEYASSLLLLKVILPSSEDREKRAGGWKKRMETAKLSNPVPLPLAAGFGSCLKISQGKEKSLGGGGPGKSKTI